MKIQKAVIPAAGLGTRLLSATKEQPKEMLPVFYKGSASMPGIKPLMQLIFEQLYDCDFREFCFVVGRGKRTIEDHFTPDFQYIESLKKAGKSAQSRELESFYKKIESSTILWINQSSPKGFGDAVRVAKPFCSEPFLVHAGDTYIMSKNNDHIRRLLSAYDKSYIAIMLKEVEDPRKYGVATLQKNGGTLVVTHVEEKPDKPISRFAIMPLYVFGNGIFENLDRIGTGKGNEVQLTDAVQDAISAGKRVTGVPLHEKEIMLDIGTPDSYWEALETTYSLCSDNS